MTRFVRSYAAARFGLHMPEDMTENLLVEHGKLGVLDTLLAPYIHDHWMTVEREQSLQFPYPEEYVVDTDRGPIVKVPISMHIVPAWAVEIAAAVIVHREAVGIGGVVTWAAAKRLIAWCAQEPVERAPVLVAACRLAGVGAALALVPRGFKL